MQRWQELQGKGLVEAAGLGEDVSVACLRGWSTTAAADLALVAALQNRLLQPEDTLSAALATAAAQSSGPEGGWHLHRCTSRLASVSLWMLPQLFGASYLYHVCRMLSKNAVRELEQEVEQRRGSASAFILAVASSAAEHAAAEVAAAEQLQEVVTATTSDVRAAVQHLEAAIAAAAHFPRLDVSPYTFPRTQ